jgi:hypothetical protein
MRSLHLCDTALVLWVSLWDVLNTNLCYPLSSPSDVRSLHFGPALASPLLSRAATPIISPVDSPKKPKNTQTATHTAPLSISIPAADTTHIHGSDHAEKDATASSSSSSTAAPVPVLSGPVSGTGTSTPEILSTQGPPLSPSGSTAAGSVWGAKRSFLDVSMHLFEHMNVQ